MRKNFAIIIFVLLFCFSIFSQEESLRCPNIEIDAPKSVAQEGEIITFAVSNKIKNEYEKVEYKWTVDKGKIIKGQGTSKIEVDTTGFDDAVINASLEIYNLPPDCKTSFSASGVVSTIKDYFPRDQYGKLPLKEEFSRIDALLIELVNVPEFQGYVVISVNEKTPLDKVRNRVKKLVKHIKYRGFPVERITFLLDKNSNEDKTVIRRFPKDSDFTQCDQCEEIKLSK